MITSEGTMRKQTQTFNLYHSMPPKTFQRSEVRGASWLALATKSTIMALRRHPKNYRIAKILPFLNYAFPFRSISIFSYFSLYHISFPSPPPPPHFYFSPTEQRKCGEWKCGGCGGGKTKEM